MLEARGLVRRFGDRRAVDGIDLRIDAGEVVGLLGPNGAGKTTTISMIAGVLRPDAGSIQVDGIDIRAGPPARARIGLVTQWLTLYPDISGRENLEFWGRMYDVDRRRLKAAVAATLDAVGLVERADDVVETYSGGMQRRLNLAIALMHEPSLLILDEPCVGVDPQSRNAIFELIEGRRDDGVAVLYTTHYMEEAARLCDRVAIVDGGRIVTEGSPAALVARLGTRAALRIRLADPARTFGAQALLARDEDSRVSVPVEGTLLVHTAEGSARIPAITAVLLDAGIAPASIDVLTPNLEDVFLELTGKALRD